MDPSKLLHFIFPPKSDTVRACTMRANLANQYVPTLAAVPPILPQVHVAASLSVGAHVVGLAHAVAVRHPLRWAAVAGNAHRRVVVAVLADVVAVLGVVGGNDDVAIAAEALDGLDDVLVLLPAYVRVGLAQGEAGEAGGGEDESGDLHGGRFVGRDRSLKV